MALTRIFISYGRKDTEDFAHELADWLRTQGHEPWLDVENGIPIGAPFDLRIELGISESDAVVALLSPWSLRQEGFCRNEILYAQHAGRPIIPIRLAHVVPPIQIIALNYIDAAGDPDLVFVELPGAIRRVTSSGGMGYRPWGGELQPAAWWTRLQPDRFEEELARHGGSFVGRDWLFDEVRVWADKPNSRLLLVTADAGFGKSAAAAQMSARLNVRGVHFCTRSIPESCRPDRWLAGLVYQLAAQFPAYRETLAALPAEPNWDEEPVSLFRKLIADPLLAMRAQSADTVAIDEPWVFIVDALDEASAEAGPGMVHLLVESAERMPDFLRIVVTCRPDRRIVPQFRLDGVQRRHLEASGEPNRRDLRTYVERRLEALRASSPALFPPGTAAQLVSLADGNFLFAKLSLNALSEADPSSRLSLDDISALKPELGGLYCAMFRKRFKNQTAFKKKILPLLEILVAAQGPIPEGLLEEASSLDAATFHSGIAALSQFLTGGAGGWRLFHQSLADWLCDPEASIRYFVSPRSGHERLSEVGWREFAASALCPEPYSLAPYTLAHLSAHLGGTGQWDRLAELLTDLKYVEQRVANGHVFDLVRAYNVAIAALPETQAGRRRREGLEARSTMWATEMVDYAAQWSARWDKLEAGLQADGPEPVMPISPPPCRMWTEDEIQVECDRVLASPARGDRIDAFARFVSSQCYPLAEFGGRDGFVRQHAFNWEPAGPVRAAASELMDGIDTRWIERKWPAGARPNPRPAELRTLEGHSDGIGSVGVTPDGRRAVSGSADKTLRFWDLESGACLRVLEGHSNRIQSVCVTPDGRRAVSGSSDKTLRVWDLESGVCLHVLEGHSDWIQSVGVTPDGRRAVSGSSDKTLRVWDLERGTCLRVLEGHTNGIVSASVTPDGRRAISGSLDNTLRVWDLENGTCLRVLEDRSHLIESVSVTPDGRRAVSRSSDKTLRFWDLESGACLRVLEGHSHWVRSLAITPDGRRAVLGNEDNTLRVWDLESGACLRELEGHSDWIQSVSVTPDGRRAVSGSSDKTLRFWDLESGACLSVIEGHSNLIESLSVTPDGRRAVSGSSDKALRVWDLESGACLRVLESRSHWIRSLSVTPDGHRAILGSWDKTLRVWDLESGTCLRALEGHSDWIRSVSVTPDGLRAVSGSADKTLRVWDLESGACLRVLEGHSDWIQSVSVTPDGRLAVSGSADKTLRVWDLESGACLCVFEGDGNGRGGARVTPDGRRAVLGSADKTLRVWDLQSGADLRVLEGHSDQIEIVSVTPDCRFAVSGSWDTTLRVWDLESGACLRVLKGHSSAITSVSVTSDGRRAVSGSADNTLRVWDLESGECLGLYRASIVSGALALFDDGRGVCLASGGEVLVLAIH